MLNIINIINRIARHPLNKKQKIKSVFRFFKWQVRSRLFTNPIKVNFVNKTKLLVNKGMTGATGNIYSGLHEYEEMSFLLHYLRNDDLFVDIGANVGSYTILSSGVIGARSISFEPLEETFKYLKRNITFNNLESRVITHNIGLSEKNDFLIFTKNKDTMNHVVLNDSKKNKTIKVPVKKLDDVLKNENISLIKIDVEGHEYPILKGAQKILSKESLKAIIIETNQNGKKYGIEDSTINNYLLKFGFTASTYDPQKKKLKLLDKNTWNDGNTIYLRNIDFVNSRISKPSNFKLSTGIVV